MENAVRGLAHSTFGFSSGFAVSFILTVRSSALHARPSAQKFREHRDNAAAERIYMVFSCSSCIPLQYRRSPRSSSIGELYLASCDHGNNSVCWDTWH